MIDVAALTDERDRYEVDLEVFKGPLDLLLHLIERRELDITLISLAAVTDQYIEYVHRLVKPDADELADFLVIAARLLAIKALALVTKPAQQAVLVEEDGEDLVRSLREYQLFRQVAIVLRGWEAEPRRCYPRLVPMVPVRVPTLEGLSLSDLLNAIDTILNPTPPRDEPPPLPRLPYTVSDKVSLIESVLSERHACYFHELQRLDAPFLEFVVTFLALLELVKGGTVDTHQADVFGPIAISHRLAEGSLACVGAGLA